MDRIMLEANCLSNTELCMVYQLWRLRQLEISALTKSLAESVITDLSVVCMCEQSSTDSQLETTLDEPRYRKT
jgi:hypothetical protein